MGTIATHTWGQQRGRSWPSDLQILAGPAHMSGCQLAVGGSELPLTGEWADLALRQVSLTQQHTSLGMAMRKVQETPSAEPIWSLCLHPICTYPLAKLSHRAEPRVKGSADHLPHSWQALQARWEPRFRGQALLSIYHALWYLFNSLSK